MSKNTKYKIPKARALMPILGYTLIFIVLVGSIFGVLSLLADFVKDVRSESDRAYVESVVERYDKAADSERAKVLGTLISDGYEYCIVDRDGKIITSTISDITCDGFNSKNNSFSEQAALEMYQDAGLEEDKAHKLWFSIFGGGQAESFILEDQKSDAAAFAKAMELGRSDDLYGMKSDELVITFPYWIGKAMRSTDKVILVKSELSVKVKDYVYLVAGMIIAIFIALIIFIIMIMGVVRNLSANRKMRKLLFRDNIAKGRNWLWYATSSQDILRKRGNANKTFAVVELVFVKYRRFVLCHSVKEAEDLLKKSIQIIDSKLGRQELCAHSSSSGIPLLLQVTDEENARIRIQDIISTLESIYPGHQLAFRAGVYLVTPAQEKVLMNQKRYVPDIDMLYNNASTAGLSISESGESGIAFFDSKLVDEEKWINTVTERQHQAIANEEFLVYYQPKYDPKTSELRGAEALIRWNAPDMGLVPPGKFIPIFEESGFITQIDDYMLIHVARDQRRWLNEGRKCVPVSVNVSRAHFGQYDLAEYICALIDREGCPHSLLEIELTESAFFDDENAMIKTINRLKELGFLVSMDDFGSGYSSLNSLKDMPLDILKLDAGFFRGSEDNPRTEIVVSEAIRLAKSLNMKTVAEGVEEKATVDFLAREGCDMIQGYYFARPMPRSEYEVCIPIVNPPVQPVQQPVQYAQPVVQAPAQYTQPVQYAQPVVQAPVQYAQPVQQVPVTQPVQYAQPVTQAPVQHVQPVQQVPVSQPVQQPVAQPVQPSQPVAPVQPAQPEQPIPPAQ